MATRDLLTNCCKVLIAAEDDLKLLDAKSGDGDTGSTLAGASRALIDAMDRLPIADHTRLYRYDCAGAQGPVEPKQGGYFG